MPCTVRFTNLVLIARDVFRAQTHRHTTSQTQMITLITHFSSIASRDNVVTFLPRDSYANRGICRRRVSVRLCVCVCVCVCVCLTPVLYENG